MPRDASNEENAMRVTACTAAFLMTAAIFSTASLTAPASAHPACPCDCPHPHKVVHVVHAHPHPIVRETVEERYDEYSYESSSRVDQDDWHGAWHVAPSETPMMVAPTAYYYVPFTYYAYYGPAAGYYGGMQMDAGGFTGGVGYDAAYAQGGGGFVDGFGQAHFEGGGFPNGPSFNSFGQSFVPNPSMPGPFAGRPMGFAPGRAR
jgi:hypothetical protein